MKNRSAFTLIELLMGTLIMTLVFTVGIAGFRSFSRRHALEGVTKTAKADLRLAQSMASSGQKPTGCTQLDGYTFKIVNNTRYQIVANCTNNQNPIFKTVNLTTSTITGADTQFKALGQGTNLSGDITITFTSTAGGDTSLIIIGKGGEIK